jgi:hypothetical protein
MQKVPEWVLSSTAALVSTKAARARLAAKEITRSTELGKIAGWVLTKTKAARGMAGKVRARATSVREGERKISG